MDWRGISAVILLLCIAFPPVGAQEVAYDTKIILTESAAHEIITIDLNNTGDFPLEDFSYQLPSDALNIHVTDEKGSLEPEIMRADNVVINSNFRDPIQPGTIGMVKVEFDTSELVSPVGGEFIFSALFSPPPSSKPAFRLEIVLPRGMGLSNPISSGVRTDIVPLPDETLSDGSSTSFVWDVREVKDFAVFVRYGPLINPTTQSPSTPPPTTRQTGSNIPMIFILSLLAAVAIAYSLYRSKKSAVEGKTEFMKDDEKRIIELIREDEGIVQKRLGDKTGFSKAKVSKIVSDLEKRKIVRVQKIGRRNKLYLTEEFKKK